MTNEKLAQLAVDEIANNLDLRIVPEAKLIAEAIIVQWLRHRESLGTTRWARFVRWWHGGYEYGHTGETKFNIQYRRNVRSGVVEMRRPLGWIPIHRDHWHKFVVVEVS